MCVGVLSGAPGCQGGHSAYAAHIHNLIVVGNKCFFMQIDAIVARHAVVKIHGGTAGFLLATEHHQR